MHPRRILIADDDADVLRILCALLKSEGHEVISARDGYQALEKARRNPPDVMILDVNMPAGDGFSVLERIQKQPDLASTPAIYLTGEWSERVELASKQLGAVGVILKPFEHRDLLTMIDEATTSKSKSTADTSGGA